jgi:hypothetical protein
MDWRLISVVAPVGASLIALTACTAAAADTIKPKRDIPAQARCLTVSQLMVTEKGRPQVATRRGAGEERSTPRMALVLGTAY